MTGLDGNQEPYRSRQEPYSLESEPHSGRGQSYGGYAGRILRVELTTGEVSTERLDPGLARLLLGGKGLATWYLLQNVPAHAGAHGPENALILFTGPLTGTLAPTSGRIGLATKSPTTGAYLDSYCGGFFGAVLKWAGYDLVIITGKASKPMVLVIDDAAVRLEPAEGLWGLTTDRAADELARRYPSFESLAIGPAGERLSPIATVNNGSRTAARGGIGAVFGAKQLKAVVVRGTGQVKVARHKEFLHACRVAYRTLRMNPAIQRLKKDGSANILELISASGGLPTMNYQRGDFAGADELMGEAWRENEWQQDTACFGCPITCAKVAEVKVGPYAGTWVDGPDYETVMAFGSNLGISDRAAIIRANYLCDTYGVDTISAGGIIGFVMELFERGLITADELDGIAPRWGDGEAAVGLLEKIASGTGVGRRLERGVRALSAEFPGSEAFAMHVKGLEMPAYLPRAAKGVALGYAVSERGACHLHGAPIGELLGAANPRTTEGKAALMRAKQIDAAIIDSTVHCFFADFGMTLKEVYELVVTATGLPYRSVKDLEVVAERIITLTRLFNLREGFTRRDDTLPARSLAEPVPAGPAAGETVNLEPMLSEYYQLMGWDEGGRPRPERLAELGLAGLGLAELEPSGRKTSTPEGDVRL